MTIYKTMNMDGLTGKDLKSGDRITINARFMDTEIYSRGVLTLSHKIINKFRDIGDLSKSLVKLDRPVENCRTEYKREDFHVGDKITWWYRGHPDEDIEDFITSVDIANWSDEAWTIGTEQHWSLAPFASSRRAYSVVVTNIEHKKIETGDDEWEEVDNWGAAERVVINDTGLHIDAIISEIDSCNIADALDTIKDEYIRGQELKYYRHKPKPCDMSRIDHGYFMLMDCKTHEWHNDDVWSINAATGEVKHYRQSEGSWCVSAIQNLPVDTFAVEPDSKIFLGTMNGDL